MLVGFIRMYSTRVFVPFESSSSLVQIGADALHFYVGRDAPKMAEWHSRCGTCQCSDAVVTWTLYARQCIRFSYKERP